MDVMVYETQKWLNENYTGKNGYIPLDLSDESEIKGRTGWTTIYALLRAFQIRLGIEKPADSFGPATRAAFNSNFENGIIEQAEDSEEEDDIYAIIQGALWCKGYSTGLGTITRQFKKSVGDAIKLLKREAGLPDYTSTITLNIMESLLSMKQFRLVSGGDINIQAVQRKVNEKYVPYTGIVPCDGVYGREMNKALIQVLQCIEGLSPADATGNFGNYTKNNCPIISSTQPSNLSKDEYENAVQLIKFALTCNGYYPGSLDGTWSSAVTMHLSLFQEAHDLPQSPVCNLNTWMALLLSSGNPDRAAIACDTATILNEKMAQALYSAGYRYVGRYLTGTVGGTRSKALTEKEANIIFAAGLKIFAIFQTGAAYLGRYTYEKGVRDGLEAIEAADMLGIPYNEIIYFAVDYDLQGAEIQSNAVPYFSGIKKSFQQHPGKYRIGVYGTRNTCSKITEAGHAVSSFVADMSTGFSGNMGFKIPSNWAFDQFAEITFSYSGGTIGIDKDGYSGRYSGFDKLEKHPDPVMSEEVRKALSERGAFIIESIGVLGISDFTVSQVYKYNIQLSEGIWEVEYGTTVNTKVVIIDTVKSATVDVKDGKFNENLIADMMSVLHITCGGNEESINLQMKMLTEIAGKITNGKVKVGVSVDIVTKKITFSYQVEETYNYNDELTCTLTTYVKLSIKSDDNFMQEFQRALEAVDVYAYNELRVTLGITAVILFLFELFYFLPAV